MTYTILKILMYIADSDKEAGEDRKKTHFNEALNLLPDSNKNLNTWIINYDSLFVAFSVLYIFNVTWVVWMFLLTVANLIVWSQEKNPGTLLNFTEIFLGNSFWGFSEFLSTFPMRRPSQRGSLTLLCCISIYNLVYAYIYITCL